MAKYWDHYSRNGLDIALGVSSVGFQAAKAGTRFGVSHPTNRTYGCSFRPQFSVARTVANAAASVTSFAVDQTVFGGTSVTSPLFHGAVSTVLTVAEQCTLAPIYLGEYITSTSVLAAHSSINALAVIFPGSSEASFSLASFIHLVRREWAQAEDPQRPQKQYGLTKVAWAIVGWVSLQGVTQEWQEKRWFKHLREIDVSTPPEPKTPSVLSRKPSRVRVTSDVILPGQGGAQIITANIGEDSPESSRRSLRRTMSRSSISSIRSMMSFKSPAFNFTPMEGQEPGPLPLPNPELKANFRRFSKLCLAGYGGASLWFFGISPSQLYPSKDASKPKSVETEKTLEEAKLATAIDASEAEAAGELDDTPSLPAESGELKYSLWDILLGKHDQEIFENTVDPGQPSKTALKNLRKSNIKARAVIGNQHLMPRFWILTDYNRQEIVLVIRGTMSLNEIAADLTCEPDWFEPARTPPVIEDDDAPHEGLLFPGQFTFPPKPPSASRTPGTRYHVHGGMLRLARAMGEVGKPVQVAVKEALSSNPDFDLVLCGHSLGAGVAALLGMIWADPETCLTVPASGLPAGRNVQVYCYAPPALTDAALGRLADKLIISFVYSHDIVSRLSLGSIRDIRNAAMWLCEANEAAGTDKKSEGYSAISERARKWKAGKGYKGDMEWFIAMRKSLEANMQNVDMYPAGRVFWAFRDEDFHPSHRRYSEERDRAKLRLFEVLDVKEVFSQIVFAKDMLSSHMPHQYDKILHELL
ncbi:hypothetical protein DFP72DRAFT_559729 [Ephemerocybe angulata]|uniref:sn-1-specific diacylglycerol lipase n=1 Tax=Ephemerocybe angulata TaxID=980116 RepID=A0A8H6IBJ6_9AGAR|nr:hypothetical protein DFP72DRAFT_559729 [Tulosesus angulatus]